MSDSTTNLDQLSFGQVEKEVIANELFDAASTSMTFGRHGSACVALTWGYYGGVWSVDSVPTAFANGTLSLTDNATCYIYFDYSSAADSPPGAPLAFATSPPASWPGPNGSDIPLYEVTTVNGAITAWTDWRPARGPQGATGPEGPAWTPTVLALVDSDSPSGYYVIDSAAYDIYDITLNMNINVDFTNGIDGKMNVVRFKQDGSGNHTVTFSSNVRFGADIPSLTLSTGASKLDYVAFRYNSSAAKWDLIAAVQGF